jgi:ABC-type bacteriocin/lantibiotic exporter with double-glycine peptidase domain
MSSRMIEIFAVCGLFILVVIDTYSSDNVFSMITIGSFMVAAYKVIPGIVKIMNGMGQIKTYEYTIKNIMPDKNMQRLAVNTVKKTEKISCIEFNEVSFRYDHGRGVHKFSLSLVEGDLIGISGTSGRGKTTVINLLLGFLKPDSGNIYINNDMTSSAGAFYRNQISYIKQQSFFIHDTLLKNITLDDAGYDNEKLNEVIRLTGLELVISMFSEGLNYVITENGKNLSGGQRQRIMVARALYHDFDLLIMDEPFSQLDDFAEDNLLNQLKLIAQKGKIIILITHNKNSLSYCSKVISLDAA